MNLDEASRAILGIGIDTSGPIQTGPMFDEGAIAPREPAVMTPTAAPPPPNGAPLVNGQPAPNGNGTPWMKWALTAAVVAGVAGGVYYFTRDKD